MLSPGIKQNVFPGQITVRNRFRVQRGAYLSRWSLPKQVPHSGRDNSGDSDSQYLLALLPESWRLSQGKQMGEPLSVTAEHYCQRQPAALFHIEVSALPELVLSTSQGRKLRLTKAPFGKMSFSWYENPGLSPQGGKRGPKFVSAAPVTQ